MHPDIRGGGTSYCAETEERIATLIAGIEINPTEHVRRLEFGLELLLLDRATRLRVCRAAVALLERSNIYASGFIPSLLDYLTPDEVRQFKEDLANRKFFSEIMPDFGREMLLSDLPIVLR